MMWLIVLSLISAVALATNQLQFSYSGGIQNWTVPDSVSWIFVDGYGAAGGTGNSNLMGNTQVGGFGGRLSANLTNLNAGTILHIFIGGAGQGYNSPVPGLGGYNGGGTGSDGGLHFGAGGGGAVDIRVGTTDLSGRIFVAGGGGGGGGNCEITDGQASGSGGYIGNDGSNCQNVANGQPGTGGTQTAGGIGGSYSGNTAEDGGLGYGGNSGGGTGDGGGGGGFYGGGGGGVASGGGGSSFCDSFFCLNVNYYANGDGSVGNGLLILTYESTGPTPSFQPTTQQLSSQPSLSSTQLPTVRPPTHEPSMNPSRVPTVHPTVTGTAPTQSPTIGSGSSTSSGLSSTARAGVGVTIGIVGGAIGLWFVYQYLLFQWRKKTSREQFMSQDQNPPPGGAPFSTENPVHKGLGAGSVGSVDDGVGRESRHTIEKEVAGDIEVATRSSNLQPESVPPPVAAAAVTATAIVSTEAAAVTAVTTTGADPAEKESKWKTWLLSFPIVQRILAHPSVVEFQEFYADPDNREQIEAIMRFLVVASHIANSISTMSFYINIPTCCHKAANQALATAIPTVGLFFALINFAHLFKSWPHLTASHFYLTAIYDLVLMINLIFMVLIMQYGSFTTYFMSLANALYGLSVTYVKTLKRVYNLKPFTIWSGWVMLNLLLWGPFMLLQVLFIIIGLAFSSYGKAFFFYWSESGFIGNTDIISLAWHVNRPGSRDEINALFANCTANFAYTNSYTASQGGQVAQYCTFADDATNYQGHGCCTWEMFN